MPLRLVVIIVFPKEFKVLIINKQIQKARPCGINRRKEVTEVRSVTPRNLFPDAQLGNQGAIALNVLTLEVVEKAPAFADHL